MGKKLKNQKWILLISIGVLVFTKCAPGRSDFQSFEPEADVKLTEIFNETPAILSAFRKLNAKEFNQKMTALVHRDPVASLKFLLTLADLTDSSNPAIPAPLPRIFDSLSYDIAQLARYYQNHDTEEFNTAVQVGSRILDVEPSAITYGSSVLARLVRYVADINPLFPNDHINSPPGHNTFAPLTLWRRCKDPAGDFAAAMPASQYDGRNALADLYDMLRIAYCFYEGRTPPQEGPGQFMRKVLETIRDAGDVENRMADMAYSLRQDVAKIKDVEATLADWLIKDPDKVSITDYLVTHGYTVLRKDYIFAEGKPLLDLEAAHLSIKNPAYSDNTPGNSDYNNVNREYLFEWLLDSLYEDSPLLSHLDDDTITDLSVIYSNPLYKFGKDLVHHATFGYKNALSTYTKPKLRNILWNGWTYDAATGTDPFFKGILYSDGTSSIDNDGPVVQMAQRYSSQNIYNHFREQARSNLSSVLPVNPTYSGESMLSAILNNIYLYLKTRFYSATHNRWVLDADDAVQYFNDPERSLLKYIGSLQYSLRNAIMLNPYGEAPGTAPAWATPPGSTNTAYRNLPYLSALLYTIAASNGFVDQENAPAELTLQKSLASMGANIDSNGIRTIDMPNPLPDMHVRVACPGHPPCDTRVYRNGKHYTTYLGMFDFELLSPGRFISREGHSGPGGFNNHGWQGRFSSQQGDIETTKTKTANWVMAEMALNLWMGYGPYTYKGRAPNGSVPKYRNDYYTDTYRVILKYRPSFSGSYTEKNVAMGSNAGFEDCSWPCDPSQDKNGDIISGEGKYHVYERIYIPRNPGDPCYMDSRTDGVNTYSYPRFGYIRPSNNQNYHNNSYCTSWPKVQIDFDTLEEAITANLEWLLKYKKYTFVIPMSGDTDLCTGFCNGAAFAVISTINANGIYGVTNAKRAGPNPTDNGRWNSNVANMSARSNGLIPNSGNGFISEGIHDGAYTVRFGVTSFEPADSSVVLEINGRYWGLTMVIVDVFQEIWDTLGNGPVTPAIIGENFAPILAMAEARYTPSDLMHNPAQGPDPNLLKFKKFYDTYFPADDTVCVAGTISPGSNGQPDLFENYQNGCIKARDLPPVPRVNPNPNTCKPSHTASCIKYPRTYDAAGNVATWYAYTGASESRFSGIVVPFAIIVGTMHEDGGIRKTNGNLVAPGENRDIVEIRNFEANGFREHIDTFLTLLTSLNEARKQSSNNLPEYNATSLINLLTETAPGMRNGFLPKLVTNKYANVAYLDPLINDVENMIRTLTQHVMNQFELFKGNNPGSLKNIDKLRYFTTKRVIDEGKFPTNNLGKNAQGKPNGTSDEPINQLKSFLAYLRKLTTDEEVKKAVKEGVGILNKYFDIQNMSLSLDVSDEDIDKVFGFLNAKSKITDKYITDGILDLVVDLKLNDPRQLYNFDFDNFKNTATNNWGDQLDEISKTLADYFGEDYDFKKKVLFSSLFLGEPTCSGGPNQGFYDANKDGIYNRGILRFVNAAYSPGKSITVKTNVGTTCTVNVPEPNIYEPHFYVLHFDNIAWYLNDKLVGNTITKVNEIIDFVFDLNYDQKIDKIKDDLFAEFYNKTLDEPSVDRNKNGTIEAGEFTDINGNNVFDQDTITMRDFIEYYLSKNTLLSQSKFRKLYQDLRDNKYLKAFMLAMNDLFNPLNPINVTCTDDDPLNNSPNCLYITGDLVKAQKDFLDATNFTPEELKAVKRVVGRFFYDSHLEQYTYPISNVAQDLSHFISAFQGQYVGLLEMGIAGFAPDGFLTYLSQMKTDPEYSGIDVLLDLRTLANTQAMRCYTGKNAPYCQNKTKKEMFWPQLSQLLRNFAETAYKQHRFTFSPELNFKYYQMIQETF
ncbi:MAG: hypothetical protein NZM25_10020 [Leptospiraceae bacterium]|nr:hypothetical protein [Leptospiraceae bacterium]MDW8307485.1 hypothetical protein [Leptospiraceae bacterium]